MILKCIQSKIVIFKCIQFQKEWYSNAADFKVSDTQMHTISYLLLTKPSWKEHTTNVNGKNNKVN